MRSIRINKDWPSTFTFEDQSDYYLRTIGGKPNYTGEPRVTQLLGSARHKDEISSLRYWKPIRQEDVDTFNNFPTAYYSLFSIEGSSFPLDLITFAINKNK